MKIIVLIANYFLVGFLALALIGLSGLPPEDVGSAVLVVLILAPIAVLNLIYAHSK